MKNLTKIFVLMLAGILFCTNNAWAVDVTYTFSSATGNPGNGVAWTSGTIDSYTSWSATKGGSTDPAYYNTGSGLRVYNGGKFTVTSTKTISTITLTFSSTGYTFSSSNTTTPQSVLPNAKSYSWDVSRTCRLQKIEITYSSSSSSATTYTVTFVDGVHGTDCTGYTMSDKAVGTQIVFPSISDKTEKTSGTCQEVHYHFAGWIEEGQTPNSTGSNVIAAGTTTINISKNVTYKAVWAKKQL